MYTIEQQIEINANAARIVEALTTEAGIAGWWTTDTDVGDREAAFRFTKQDTRVEHRFQIERRDASGVAMTCVSDTDWRGTRLAFELAPAGARTTVRLVHAGYPAKNELYAQCTKGWAYFLDSLQKYVETGTGTPHVPATKQIVDRVEIAAPPARVLAALSTSDGVARWWTADNAVSASEHTYRFRKGEQRAHSTFRVESADARGIALVCTDSTMGWLGTRLAFSAEPAGPGASVGLVHGGFPIDSACYDECVGGWKHFLGSLKAYLETGTGTPHTPGDDDCH
jgi:uncharacterized protein YndB with AHSA1/START domain